MRTNAMLFRLTASVALAALLVGQAAAPMAWAQPAPRATDTASPPDPQIPPEPEVAQPAALDPEQPAAPTAPASEIAPVPTPMGAMPPSVVTPGGGDPGMAGTASGLTPAPSSTSGQFVVEDPPERVGRLARVSGAVSFRTVEDSQWSQARANYPVSTGNAFWTEPNAEAELQLGDSRIVTAGGTEFFVDSLDAAGLRATSGQGQMYVRVDRLAPNEVWTLQTPRGLVRIDSPGRYVVAVGDTATPTTVTVLAGGAYVQTANAGLRVAAGQTATLSGDATVEAALGPARRDAFTESMLARERPPPRPPAMLPPAVAAMPGAEDLATVGTWGEAPEYGRVWYPPVSAGWVPYRQGHWAFIAPWGWTWVDDAPWGFAPFHYGRWVALGGRWAWYPGSRGVVADRPVYAPALVTFLGGGTSVGVAARAALAHNPVCWVPLGPREPFRPWYRASDRYMRAVNMTHVTNVTTINNNVTINNFVNRRSATLVPGEALAASRPIASVARPVTPNALAGARPVTGHMPLAPTQATAGVTPAVARRMQFPPGAAGTPIHHAAPGPIVPPASLRETPARPGAQPVPGLANPGGRGAPVTFGRAGTPQGGAHLSVQPPHAGTSMPAGRPTTATPAFGSRPGVAGPAGAVARPEAVGVPPPASAGMAGQPGGSRVPPLLTQGGHSRPPVSRPPAPGAGLAGTAPSGLSAVSGLVSDALSGFRAGASGPAPHILSPGLPPGPGSPGGGLAPDLLARGLRTGTGATGAVTAGTSGPAGGPRLYGAPGAMGTGAGTVPRAGPPVGMAPRADVTTSSPPIRYPDAGFAGPPGGFAQPRPPPGFAGQPAGSPALPHLPPSGFAPPRPAPGLATPPPGMPSTPHGVPAFVVPRPSPPVAPQPSTAAAPRVVSPHVTVPQTSFRPPPSAAPRPQMPMMHAAPAPPVRPAAPAPQQPPQQHRRP